ncbi:MAG: T9SS type A sorting domain-containing protein [candidate division KSB1 bacterium]|nr:T9SS type A sorting domain-containing protein [candidate division KSB1 bacterium]
MKFSSGITILILFITTHGLYGGIHSAAKSLPLNNRDSKFSAPVIHLSEKAASPVSQLVFPATSNKSVIDSIIFVRQGYYYKYTGAMNSDHNWTSTLYQTWDYDSDIWSDLYRTLYRYDARGNRIETLEQLWDNQGAKWVQDTRNTRAFSDDKLTTQLQEMWNSEEQSWEKTEQVHFAWDKDGNIQSTTLQSWDSLSGSWKNNRSYSFTYTDKGRQATGLLQTWDGQSETWVNEMREFYTYSQGKLIHYRADRLDSLSGKWINNWQQTNHYDNARQLIYAIYKQWIEDEQDWRNDQQVHYEYDDNGNRLHGLWQSWNALYQRWEDYWMMTYEYDESGNMILFESRGWNGYEWVSGSAACEFEDAYHNFSFTCSELSAYYSSVSPVHHRNQPLNFRLMQNYPNPFNPVTCIEYELSHPSHVQLIVYNAIGEQIDKLVDSMQSTGSHQVIFDGSALPSGSYYYILKTDHRVDSKKMLMIK